MRLTQGLPSLCRQPAGVRRRCGPGLGARTRSRRRSSVGPENHPQPHGRTRPQARRRGEHQLSGTGAAGDPAEPRSCCRPSKAMRSNNPAWPKDPDVERRKAQAAMEKNRNISDERERETKSDASRSDDAGRPRQAAEAAAGPDRRRLSGACIRLQQPAARHGARLQGEISMTRCSARTKKSRRNLPASHRVPR